MSLSLFRATFHDSGIPQAIKDLEGTVIDANEAFCRLLGYDDLCGADAQSLLPEECRYEEGYDPTVKAFEGRKNYLSRKQYLKKDGSRVWVDVYYSAVYESDRIKYVLAQVLDLSSQHALESDLETKQMELERFAYIASHDLREPLSTVAGYATLIQKRCSEDLSENGLHWLDEIILGTQRMAEKVDDLLEFSRAGRHSPRGCFPLGAAIEEGKRALAGKFRETKGEVVIEGTLPTVCGDRSMLAQVFQNLFSNSLKYRSDEVPRIVIRAEFLNSMWRVSVSDNGLGFDSDQFGERIFGVFQRLYTTEKYPGTGIGLAIAKKIVERHGGSIWVESAPEEGSRFYFTLPPAP